MEDGGASETEKKKVFFPHGEVCTGGGLMRKGITGVKGDVCKNLKKQEITTKKEGKKRGYQGPKEKQATRHHRERKDGEKRKREDQLP